MFLKPALQYMLFGHRLGCLKKGLLCMSICYFLRVDMLALPLNGQHVSSVFGVPGTCTCSLLIMNPLALPWKLITY